MADATNLPRDLVEMARGVIDTNRYLTLGTTDRVEVHVPGRDPLYGLGVDTRREITL